MVIHNPAHPGEVLRNYLGDRTVAEAAKGLRVTCTYLVPVPHIDGHAGVTADMSLRLAGSRVQGRTFGKNAAEL